MQELKLLERQGQHLFHGSPVGDIQEIEPRQPHSHGRKDGQPCIAATEIVELAAFMAIFKTRTTHHFGWDGKYGTAANPIGMYVDWRDYDSALQQDWFGYVYILKKDRQYFNPYFWPSENRALSKEWRAYTSIAPVGAIEVRLSEVSTPIEVIEGIKRSPASQIAIDVLQ